MHTKSPQSGERWVRVTPAETTHGFALEAQARNEIFARIVDVKNDGEVVYNRETVEGTSKQLGICLHIDHFVTLYRKVLD